MTTPAQGPGELHDEVFIFPVGVSRSLAALDARCPALGFSRHPTRAELAAGWGEYAPPTCLPADEPPKTLLSPDVTRRIGYYIDQWLVEQVDGDWMFATAHRWPAWDRTRPASPVVAECGWTDYVDSAAVRMITQGEAP